MTSSVRQRVEGRQMAELAIAELIDGQSTEWVAGVARACEVFSRKYLPKEEPPTLLTMSDEEAAKFERESITFGRYEDWWYCEIPIEYLTWLSDSNIRLASYLRSERGRKRVEVS